MSASIKSVTELGPCGSRTCVEPSAGLGPFSGLPLCREHFLCDVERVKQRQLLLLEKLRRVSEITDRRKLRAEQQSLENEIQQVSDVFDSVMEELQYWKTSVLSRVQAAHDSVAGRLRDAAEAEECQKEVTVASVAGDMRKVMELTVSMESWQNEANARSEEFEHGRQGTSSNWRSLGDVAGGVQQLLVVIDRHMADVMQQCRLSENGNSKESEELEKIQTPEAIEDLGNYPYNIAVCTNTDGYVFDSTQQVIVAASCTDNVSHVPQPCVFVSFGSNAADYLLVMSLYGRTRLKYCCQQLNWGQVITGLHCDSARKLLYIAQPQVVTVTDLSGQTEASGSFCITFGAESCVSCIDGNADKLYVLDSGRQTVTLVAKANGETQSTINLNGLTAGLVDAFLGLALLSCDGKVLLSSRSGRLCKLCSTSGLLIPGGTFPEFPAGAISLTADTGNRGGRSGRIFVAERGRNSLTVLGGDGRVLQTILAGGVSGDQRSIAAALASDLALRCPSGLALVEKQELVPDTHGISRRRLLLIVADRDNKRLLLVDFSEGLHRVCV